jgi:hypothetical protein
VKIGERSFVSSRSWRCRDDAINHVAYIAFQALYKEFCIKEQEIVDELVEKYKIKIGLLPKPKVTVNAAITAATSSWKVKGAIQQSIKDVETLPPGFPFPPNYHYYNHYYSPVMGEVCLPGLSLTQLVDVSAQQTMALMSRTGSVRDNRIGHRSHPYRLLPRLSFTALVNELYQKKRWKRPRYEYYGNKCNNEVICILHIDNRTFISDRAYLRRRDAKEEVSQKAFGVLRGSI